MSPIYPTMEAVETADYHTLCEWVRFLPGPGLGAIRGDFETVLDQEAEIKTRIHERVKEFSRFFFAPKKGEKL